MNAGIVEESALRVHHVQEEYVRGAKPLTVYGTIPVATMLFATGVNFGEETHVYERCIDPALIKGQMSAYTPAKNPDNIPTREKVHFNTLEI